MLATDRLDTKTRILAIQEEVLGILQEGSGTFADRLNRVKEMLPPLIQDAKARADGPTQLYGCLVEAALNSFAGEKQELIDQIAGFTKTDKHFIVAQEKDVTYPPETMLLDADTYGFYYALDDHYSQTWDRQNYKLPKNGGEGNPLIANLITLFYTNDNNRPVYQIDEKGYVERTSHGDSNEMRDALLKNTTQRFLAI